MITAFLTKTQIVKIHIIFIITSLFTFCKNIQDSKETKEGEDFKTFYNKFHYDSLFQIERINFPLLGINTDDMTVNDSIYFWYKDNWQIHKALDLDFEQFNVDQIFSDSLVTEIITSEDPGFVVRREFKKINERWFLVYYSNVNL